MKTLLTSLDQKLEVRIYMCGASAALKLRLAGSLALKRLNFFLFENSKPTNQQAVAASSAANNEQNALFSRLVNISPTSRGRH